MFNIKAFNKLNVAKSLIDISNRYKSTLLQCDQDILNKAFDNNYKILSPKYVVTSEYLDNINVFNDDYIKNELENMVIRHFAGKNKPSNSKIKIPDSELFWKRYVQSVRELGAPDLLILPGTKNTVNDLLWLRQGKSFRTGAAVIGSFK